MKILLDTCSFLWLILESPLLSLPAQRIIANPENEVYLSAISSWEIAVKSSMGKLPLPGRAAVYITEQRKLHGIDSLALDEEASLYIPLLPKLHSDPFDRMLICQSIVHGMTILTPDQMIAQYPVRVLW